MFSPLLRQFRDYVQALVSAGNMQYNTMLLLTDGAIHDMRETIDLVCELAVLPASIIIVGVGNADFSSM